MLQSIQSINLRVQNFYENNSFCKEIILKISRVVKRIIAMLVSIWKMVCPIHNVNKEVISNYGLSEIIKKCIFMLSADVNQYNFNGNHEGVKSSGQTALCMVAQYLLEDNISLISALNDGYDLYSKDNNCLAAEWLENFNYLNKIFEIGGCTHYSHGSGVLKNYKDILSALEAKIDDSNKIGALLRIGDEYCGIIIKKTENEMNVTIADSHGIFVNHVRRAFFCTFDNIDDSAKCLEAIFHLLKNEQDSPVSTFYSVSKRD